MKKEKKKNKGGRPKNAEVGINGKPIPKKFLVRGKVSDKGLTDSFGNF